MSGLQGPDYPKNIEAIYTAHDATAISYGGGDQTLSPACRAVYVSTSGHLAVRLVGATADVTFSNLPVGFHPIAVSIIRQSGSTAAGLALY